MRTPRLAGSLLLFFLLLSSCAWAADAEYVIHISVDGLRGDLLATWINEEPSTLPNFHRFVIEGATTFNARSDFTHTITLPNHTCMLTGRPVTQPARQDSAVPHGWTQNDNPKASQTLHNSGNPSLHYVAGVFDVVHDAGLSTALYANKSKFVLFDRSYDAAHGAPDTVPPDFGRDKIDRYVCISTGSPANAESLHAVFLRDMRVDPVRYAFVHWRDLDAIGHKCGWGGVEWRQGVGKVDRYLGGIFDLVETQPQLSGHTTILLTADHGGSGRDHSDHALAADHTIPFLLWGPHVARGADLYALNPTSRADPGTGAPDYDAVPQPIRNGDSANLVLSLLGLPPVPGSTINVRQDLQWRASVPALQPEAGAPSSSGNR